MSTINSDEIISILKEEIANYDEISKDKEVGTVVSVGDGIATIYGIDHEMCIRDREKGKDEEEHREKRRRDEQMIREILAEFLT